MKNNGRERFDEMSYKNRLKSFFQTFFVGRKFLSGFLSYNTEVNIINEIGLRYNQDIKDNPESKESIKSTIFSMLTFIDNCWVGDYTPPNMKISFNGHKKKCDWHDMFMSAINDEGIFEYIRTGN